MTAVTRGLRVLLALFVCFPAVAHAATLAAGAEHTVIVTPDGHVWAWGRNEYGQLGDGGASGSTGQRVPTQIAGLSNIIAVATNRYHTLALASDGTVWAWGANWYGQVGNGSTATQYAPVQLSLTNIIAISVGNEHSLALQSDGTVWSWGDNYFGQLGRSTSGRYDPTPTAVTAFGTATAISAGSEHSLVLKSDGTIWGVGGNWVGQLGDTTTANRSTPVQASGITTAQALSGNGAHALVRLSGGSLVSFGWNGYGQLGDNSQTDRLSAVAVSSLSNVTQVAGGWYYSAAIKSDGTAWAWGDNGQGELGDGTNTIRLVPTAISSLSNAAEIATGTDPMHSIAVTSDGTVYTWGYNGNGELGDGTTNWSNTPVAISGPNYAWKIGTPTFNAPAGTYSSDATVYISSATPGVTIHYTTNGSDPTESDPVIASGNSVTVDRTMTIKARAWKTGYQTSSIGSATYTMTVATAVPSPSGGIYSTPVTVSISSTTPNAIIHYTLDGTDPTASSPVYSGPFALGTSSYIKTLAMRNGWTSTGIWTSFVGFNYGTLPTPTISPGAGTYASSATVTLSSMAGATLYYTLDGSTPTQSSATYTGPLTIDHSCTLRVQAYHPDYTVSGVASAAYTIVVADPLLLPASGTYAAGTAITVSTATPGATLMYTLNGVDPTPSDPTIASGATLGSGNYTLKVRGWKSGLSASGVTTATYTVSTSSIVPALVAKGQGSIALRPDGTVWLWGLNRGWLPSVFAGLTGIRAIGAGNNTGYAVRSDGVLLAWTPDNGVAPSIVSGLGPVSQATAGRFHGLALQTDGTVMAWGDNSYGQLGNGSGTNSATPVAVNGLTNVAAISSAEDSALALTSDGHIWAWGGNGLGQLGDGSTTNRATPVQVSGLTNVTSIAIGSFHAMAIRSDGTVWAWGDNFSGELGNGEAFNAHLTPVQVTGLTDVIAVAAGQARSYALKSDGTVWAWGSNGFNMLGDGSGMDRYVPVQLALSNIVSISAGSFHMFALDADGVVWAWGDNMAGEIGDGTTIGRSVPAPISGPGMAWRVGAPTLSLATGVYATTQTVTVGCGDPYQQTLHYTTTGVDPTVGDATVACGGTLTIDQSVTIKVNAWRAGAPTSTVTTATYELKAIAPTLSLATGTYATPQAVSIASATPGVTLTYTLDGSEPTPTSAAYTGTITVSGFVTLKARAFRSGWTPSDSVVASYWITDPAVAAPTITPAAGTYTAPQLVALATTATGATIRYTLDGTAPTAQSRVYRFPFLVATTTTVTAQAFLPGAAPSTVTTATYQLDAAGATATPRITPGGGTFATVQTVTIAGPAGAVLRYTTSGVDPTDTDTVIASGATITVDRSLPLKVRAWLTGSTPSAVRRADFVITGALAAGPAHVVALKGDGTVWTWGNNTYGRLGDSTPTYRVAPTQVFADAIAVAAGLSHTLAVKRDGTVWAWGYNWYGQLGIGGGSVETVSTPTQVVGLTNVIAVAAGDAHSLALKADGTVWAWGYNTAGEVGDGTQSIHFSPVQVMGLKQVVRIAAFDRNSYAITSGGGSSGPLWAWGNNVAGQIGDGTTATRLTPVRVSGMTDATAVAAGFWWASAARADGSLWTWGRGPEAELARPDVGESHVPVQATLMSDLLPLLGTSLQHGGVVSRRDGLLRLWGGNTYGQLANDGHVSVWEGVPAAAIHGVTALGLGHTFTLVADASGQVWSAGANFNGELGHGPITNVGQEHFATIDGFALADNSWLAGDADGDGLPTWRELQLGTDPLNPDTNGDGIRDGAQADLNQAPDDPDSDHDGVPNWLEIQRGTDPFNPDTDGDGVNDLLDAFPLDPTRSSVPTPDPNDHTPPVITLIEPTTAHPVP